MRRCVEYRAQDELKKQHHRIGGRHRGEYSLPMLSNPTKLVPCGTCAGKGGNYILIILGGGITPVLQTCDTDLNQAVKPTHLSAACSEPNNAWFAGRAQAKGKAEVQKHLAPVARSVSWNVTAVAGNAWRIVPPRTDSQNKATLSVAGGLAERVCDFLDTHVINYQTCRARAIGASSPQMVFCSQDAGGLRLVLESSKRATVTLTLKC